MRSPGDAHELVAVFPQSAREQVAWLLPGEPVISTIPLSCARMVAFPTIG